MLKSGTTVVMSTMVILSLASCGLAPKANPTNPASGDASVASVATESTNGTCKELIGLDEAGPLIRANYLMAQADGAAPELLPAIESFSTQFHDVGSDASSNWEPLIRDLVRPFDEVIALGPNATFDYKAFKRASDTLMDRCGKSHLSASLDVSTEVAWTFECTDGLITSDGVEQSFNSLEEIWASPVFDEFERCDVQVSNPNRFEPTKKQQKAIEVANRKWDGAEEIHNVYAYLLGLCAVPRDEVNGEEWALESSRYAYKGAVMICPEASHAGEMAAWGKGTKFSDGSYVVGEEIQAGLYQLQSENVQDCYWSRTSPIGEIIDNQFIDFAPQGPTVRIHEGEGFTSERCGVWALQL